MINNLNEERLAEAFIAQWVGQIYRQLQWIERRRPRSADNYLEILEAHGRLHIETIEFLDLLLNNSAELEEVLRHTPHRYKSRYVRKNLREGNPRIDRSRVEIFIEKRWGLEPWKALHILTELLEFLQFLNAKTVHGYAS